MALYQRGRIWYADFYVQGKRVQESTELLIDARRRSSTLCVFRRSSEASMESSSRSRSQNSGGSIWSTRKRTSDLGFAMSRS